MVAKRLRRAYWLLPDCERQRKSQCEVPGESWRQMCPLSFHQPVRTRRVAWGMAEIRLRGNLSIHLCFASV